MEFDWLNWVYFGLILNFAGVVINFVLATYMIALMPNHDRIKLAVFLKEIRENTKANVMVFLNYLVPYYTLYKSMMFLINITMYYKKDFDTTAVVFMKMTKYDIGVDWRK